MLAIAWSRLRLRLIARENSIRSASAAPITFLLPNTLSPRSMIVPLAPPARAVVIAAFTWEAAPRPDPVLPEPSRISVITGAASGVDSTVTCGDGPLRSGARPAIFSCPKEAPCMSWPYTESMSRKARSSMPGSRAGCVARV